MPNTLRARLAALADEWSASERQPDDPDDPKDVAYADGVDWGKKIAAHDLRKLLDATQGLENGDGPGRDLPDNPPPALSLADPSAHAYTQTTHYPPKGAPHRRDECTGHEGPSPKTEPSNGRIHFEGGAG